VLAERIRTELARTDAPRQLSVWQVVDNPVSSGAPSGWSVQLLNAHTGLPLYVSTREEWDTVKRALLVSCQ
jgi:hypothetical protein